MPIGISLIQQSAGRPLSSTFTENTMNTTIQSNSTATAADRHAVDENLKQAILDKRQAEIDAWNNQIEQFRDNLQNLADDARQETQKRLDSVVEARNQGVEQLRQLRDATQDNFERLLKESDTAFQKLADQFHGLVEDNT
jgi:DNA anti-recombination protein RmuC